MKILYSSLFFLMIHASLHAQWISSITITPPQPTTADTITIVIENTFPSGGCDGTIATSGIIGSVVAAQSLHCMGMLTVICTDYDTLIVPPQTLPAGAYSFIYELMTGSGSPCTFGGIPPVADTVLFNVDPVTSVIERTRQTPLNIFPNPSTGKFTIRHSVGQSSIKIYSTDGRLLYSLQANTNETDIDCILSPGVYFLTQETNDTTNRIKIIVEK